MPTNPETSEPPMVSAKAEVTPELIATFRKGSKAIIEDYTNSTNPLAGMVQLLVLGHLRAFDALEAAWKHIELLERANQVTRVPAKAANFVYREKERYKPALERIEDLPALTEDRQVVIARIVHEVLRGEKP